MDWILLLNSNDCKIFSFSKKDNQLKLIKEIAHPENRSRDQDLVSDKPGHYSTDGNAGGSYAPHTDPKQVKIAQFILEIDRTLDAARLHHEFEKLTVIASSQMYGHMLQHINKNVEKLISHHIEKNLTFMSEHELLDFLKKENG